MTRYAFLFRSNVSFLRALRIASVPGQEQQKAKDLGVGFLSHWHAKSSCQTRGWEMCHVQTYIPSKQINSKIRPHRHSGKGPSELTKTERPLGGLSCLSRFRCYRLGSWWDSNNPFADSRVHKSHILQTRVLTRYGFGWSDRVARGRTEQCRNAWNNFDSSISA